MTSPVPLAEDSGLWDELSLELGATSPTEALIHARLPSTSAVTGLVLRGQAYGPFCVHARTLRARIPLEPLASEGALRAAGVVPDPCFWTSESPFLYQIELELSRGTDIVAQTSREFGIRPLGAADSRILLAGKPLVLRVIDPRLLAHPPALDAWRESATTMFVTAPDLALCDSCSRTGVMLVADFGGLPPDASRWRDVAARAAVIAIILPREHTGPVSWPSGGPLAVREERLSTTDQAVWMCELDRLPDKAPLESGAGGPTILWRTVEPCTSLDAARRGCDRLQRDAAPWGQFSGYLMRARNS